MSFIDLREAIQRDILLPSIDRKAAKKLQYAVWKHNRTVLDHRMFWDNPFLDIYTSIRLAGLPLVNIQIKKLETGDYKVLYMGDDLTIPQYKQ